MNRQQLYFSPFRRIDLVRQAEAAECGLACLVMVASHYGNETDLISSRQRHPISMKGATLASMISIAAKMGLGGRALRVELHALKDLHTPAILHWNFNHFVVLKQVKGRMAEILDPASGAYVLNMEELSRHFTGVALELTPTPEFRPKRERTPLTLSSILSFSPAAASALAQVIVLSIIIEVLVLAAPLYFQLVIDQSLVSSDVGLLLTLAVAFSILTLFTVAATALRSLATQFLGSVLSFEMQARLFHHLLRLPLEWFHKRHVGDVQSRFRSIEPIKQFVASGAITVLLDGVLSVFILALMLYYSALLTLAVVCAVGAYALLRIATLELSRRTTGDHLVAAARDQSRFLEAIRGTQTIKAAAREIERESLQRHAIAQTINAAIRTGNISIAHEAGKQTLMGLSNVLVIFLGARAVLSGEFSIGMLTAFLAYKMLFAAHVVSFVEKALEWRLLDVHLERVADIALHPREAGIDGDGYEGELAGEVEVRNLSFSYAPGEPEVLTNVTISIPKGQFVAITGPSGCGKSTLLKVLTGLYRATSGEILIDGRPIGAWSQTALRRQIGIVMQDDQLLQGTIAENISGFAERVDMARVEEVARAAQIADEIVAMPMGYQTFVGDMGSTLSGGQKQRVLIARALYGCPRILVLDEGTAHLDVATEQALSKALTALTVTRIVVAHRSETIRTAQREISLNDFGGRARVRTSGRN